MAAVHRKKVRSAAHSHLPAQRNLKNQFVRAATGPAAKTAYAVVGTVGLAALAIAIFGPKRFQREILVPAQTKISDQASQLWADARPLRAQIGRMFDGVQSQSGREKLARNFQSWIGHFKAT
jgi:NAD/NADP transhydrogenase alpha subunit